MSESLNEATEATTLETTTSVDLDEEVGLSYLASSQSIAVCFIIAINMDDFTSKPSLCFKWYEEQFGI